MVHGAVTELEQVLGERTRARSLVDERVGVHTFTARPSPGHHGRDVHGQRTGRSQTGSVELEDDHAGDRLTQRERERGCHDLVLVGLHDGDPHSHPRLAGSGLQALERARIAVVGCAPGEHRDHGAPPGDEGTGRVVRVVLELAHGLEDTLAQLVTHGLGACQHAGDRRHRHSCQPGHVAEHGRAPRAIIGHPCRVSLVRPGAADRRP
jgi:hypothetical protein